MYELVITRISHCQRELRPGYSALRPHQWLNHLTKGYEMLHISNRSIKLSSITLHHKDILLYGFLWKIQITDILLYGVYFSYEEFIILQVVVIQIFFCNLAKH